MIFLARGTPPRCLSLEAQPAPDNAECHLVAIDITERKQVEAARIRVELLAASNRELELEIARRSEVERSLRTSERQQRKLLNQSRRQQNELRRLSHLILATQEEERRRISRELHDDIAQTLVNISFHLESLSSEAKINPALLRKKVRRTQKLVEQAVEIVHHFARDLRPPALDHLGLIPALEAAVNEFTSRTKIHASFAAFPAVEALHSDQRIAIYRVVQSALSNVAKHSAAKNVRVTLEKEGRHVRLLVHDDGRSFDARRVPAARGDRRLGLLGMRERVEMVGGTFALQTNPGTGTTVEARIPLRMCLGAKTDNPEKSTALPRTAREVIPTKTRRRRTPPAHR